MLCLASGAQMLFLFPFKATVLKAMGEEAIVATKNKNTKWGGTETEGFVDAPGLLELWTWSAPATMISGHLPFCSVNEVLSIEP